MKYSRKPEIVEATQWFKNGDHPEDDVFRPFEDTGKIPKEPREGKVVRYFRHPGIDGKTICDFCMYPMHNHGFLDSKRSQNDKVCPGNWVLTDSNGLYSQCSHIFFEIHYEPVGKK